MKSKFLPALLLGSTLCLAQENQGPPSYFRTLGVDLGIQNLGYPSKEGFQPVTVDDERRSISHQMAPGQTHLVLGTQEQRPDGEAVFNEVSRIAFPKPGGRWLVLFVKAAGVSPGWKTMVFEDESWAVPAGAYRFVNLLGTPAGILLGTQTRVLAPGESVVLEATPADGQLIFRAQVYKMTGQISTKVFSTIWSINREQRQLVLILPSEESLNGVVVKRLAEFTNLLPEAPAQGPSNNTHGS